MWRVSLRLRKGEQVRYLSHRDFVRAFEFALRRADIPVAYSEGFNPRPRMSFGGATGVGVTSDDERIVIELSQPESPGEIGDRLNSTLPPGMEVLEATEIPEGAKPPTSALNASEFRLTLDLGGSCDWRSFSDALSELLASNELRISRLRDGRTRELDIRPYLLSAEIVGCEDDAAVVHVSLISGSTGGAGPKDFVQALQKVMPNVTVKSIHRVRQFHSDDSHQTQACSAE